MEDISFFLWEGFWLSSVHHDHDEEFAAIVLQQGPESIHTTHVVCIIIILKDISVSECFTAVNHVSGTGLLEGRRTMQRPIQKYLKIIL